jgi:DNA mismatch endonuclease (patch repair protein)
MGLRYRVAARPLPGTRRTADMVFSRVKVAVIVDGCFWHGCAEHYIASKSNSSY